MISMLCSSVRFIYESIRIELLVGVLYLPEPCSLFLRVEGY